MHAMNLTCVLCCASSCRLTGHFVGQSTRCILSMSAVRSCSSALKLVRVRSKEWVEAQQRARGTWLTLVGSHLDSMALAWRQGGHVMARASKAADISSHSSCTSGTNRAAVPTNSPGNCRISSSYACVGWGMWNWSLLYHMQACWSASQQHVKTCKVSGERQGDTSSSRHSLFAVRQQGV